MQAPIENEHDSGGAAWRVLYTRHQHEKLVATSLSNKGFDVFLPLYSGVRRWKDRTKEVRLPLFPSYVFVLELPSRRREVLATPGVHAMVAIGGHPAAIPKAEISALRRAVESSPGSSRIPFSGVASRFG